MLEIVMLPTVLYSNFTLLRNKKVRKYKSFFYLKIGIFYASTFII